MKHLWSPWRMSYIENHDSAEDCVFCAAPSRPDGSDNLIVLRGSGAYVILNRFPYTSGHLMIVPYQHEPSIESLDLPVLTEMMALTRTALQVLRTAYKPEGFNIGINLGDAAGAGIAVRARADGVRISSPGQSGSVRTRSGTSPWPRRKRPPRWRRRHSMSGSGGL